MAKRQSKARGSVARREPMVKVDQVPGPATPRLYTLEVSLMSGHITAKFAKQNPVVARTIQIRGDQTLADLHKAIFDAYGRWEQHFYEFQFGKGPMDPKGKRYVLAQSFEIESDEDNRPAGRVNQTAIDSLGLKMGSRFGYWFDFGDDWWQHSRTAFARMRPTTPWNARKSRWQTVCGAGIGYNMAEPVPSCLNERSQ